MRFGKPVRTNVSFNATLRKRENNYNIVDAINYKPPVYVYPSSSQLAEANVTTTIGTSGDWKFAELIENDGTSLLRLVYKDQQIQAFLPS